MAVSANTHPDAAMLKVEIRVTRAEDEKNLDQYVVYWCKVDADTASVSKGPVVTNLSKPVGTEPHVLSHVYSGTRPHDTTHVCVYGKNALGEALEVCNMP